MLTIENNVLVKCDENATEVVIPADVTEIEADAFEGCKSLKVLRFSMLFFIYSRKGSRSFSTFIGLFCTSPTAS